MPPFHFILWSLATSLQCLCSVFLPCNISLQRLCNVFATFHNYFKIPESSNVMVSERFALLLLLLLQLLLVLSTY